MCCNSDSASTSSPSTYCFHVTRDIDLAGNMMDVLFDSTTIPSMRAAWDEKREVVGLLSPRGGVVLCFRSMRMSWYTKIDTIPIVQSWLPAIYCLSPINFGHHPPCGLGGLSIDCRRRYYGLSLRLEYSNIDTRISLSCADIIVSISWKLLGFISTDGGILFHQSNTISPSPPDRPAS